MLYLGGADANKADVAVPDLTYAPSKALTQKRCCGVIQGVREDGAINCPQLQAAFGCDVCVAPQQIAGFDEGEEVSFAVTLNEKSEPQAMDLQSLTISRKATLIPRPRVEGHRVVPQEARNTPFKPLPSLPLQGLPPDALQGLPPDAATIAAISAAAIASAPKTAAGLFQRQTLNSSHPTSKASIRVDSMDLWGGEEFRSKGFGFMFCKELNDAFDTDAFFAWRNVWTFHWDRGDGFICCEQLRTLGYEGDAFRHHSEINESTTWPGQVVAFTALNDGKLLARDLRYRQPASSTLASGATNPRSDGQWGPGIVLGTGHSDRRVFRLQRVMATSDGLQPNSDGLQPLRALASNLRAMASNLIAMASNLRAMASIFSI